MITALLTGATPSCMVQDSPQIAPGSGKLPVSFIPNAGQTDPSVRFQARALGGMAFFTGSGLTLSLPRSDSMGQRDAEPSRASSNAKLELNANKFATVKVRYEGANPAARLHEAEALPGVANFLIGEDSSQWKTNLPTYSGLVYDGLYPKVRVRYDGADSVLKSTVEVDPGGDPASVRWTYEGAEDIRIDEETGNLVVVVGTAERDGVLGEDKLVEQAPIAWQSVNGENIPVPVHFQLGADHSVHYAVDAYDISRPLIIDPAILYSTFVGSRTTSNGRAMAVDSTNSVYVTGDTTATMFPTTAGVKDTSYNLGVDVFVSKLNSTGTGLAYSTFIGAAGDDYAYDIAVDTSGQAWVVGSTASTTLWPTKSAAQGTRSGVVEGFVFKLNATGSDFIFSSYHGGNADDYVYGVALDSLGNGYVTGSTTATNFPTTAGAVATANSGFVDAFFTKWSSTGVRSYSTYLGGGADDVGRAIAVTGGGDAYIAGETLSNNLNAVTLAPGVDSSYNGGVDAFVVKFTGTAPVLSKASYWGAAQDDVARGITVDTSGNAYVVGDTTSSAFPLTYNFGTIGGKDVFVTKFASTIASYLFSTRLTGTQDDAGRAIALDASNNIYVTGTTASSLFMAGTETGYKSTGRAGGDIFVTKLSSSGNTVSFNALLGGSGTDDGNDIAVDTTGVYVAGSTTSANYPTTSGAFDTFSNGGTDVVISKLDLAGSALTFSTYMAGKAADEGHAIATQSSNVFVAGYTNSSGFPTTAGVQSASYKGGANDAFVLKLNSLSNQLVYSTYIGGTGDDRAFGLAVDSGGNAVVVGSTTSSTTFPSVNPPAAVGAPSGTQADAFLVKLNSTGSAASTSFRFGGASTDYAYDVALDGSGRAYITGYTISSNFLTVSPLQPALGGSYDAFVAKLNLSGAMPSWDYSTYLGGAGIDYGHGIATDGLGNAFVVGQTASTNFPTAPSGGEIQAANGGGTDAFISMLDSAGTSLMYSTYFGGAGPDIARDVAVNATGDAYVVGETQSDGLFDTWPGISGIRNGSSTDGLFLKLTPDGTGLWYGTYFGGSGEDYLYGIAVDPSGMSTFVGYTNSPNLSIVAALPQGMSLKGGYDVVVARMEEDGDGNFYQYLFTSYLGGSADDQGRDVALYSGDAFVTGLTKSTDFSSTANAYDSSFNSETDVFVTRIDL